MRVAALAGALAVAATLAAPQTGSAARLERVAALRSPTGIAAPSGDRHRLFVTERGGAIRVIRDGRLVERKFLDLRGRVVTEVTQGLLSMAFAPDYAKSRRFYVAYTARLPGDPDGSIVTVDEFRRSASNPNRAKPESRRNLLAIRHPGSGQHHGGQLEFGPDRLLYLSVGDGGDGNAADPENRAQRLDELHGKILRIDPRPSGDRPYRIPPGNPFVDREGARPEIYTYGLRNPWRFSHDRAAGDLLIGDVGYAAFEEIDFVRRGEAAGANFGWRCREGRVPTPGLDPPCAPGGRYVRPIHVYKRASGRCALIGGVVVRSLDLSGLFGRYVYGDWCHGGIRSQLARMPDALDDRRTGMKLEHLDAFGEDACGHPYVATTHGEVYRIASGDSEPCHRMKPGTAPRLTLQFGPERRLSGDVPVPVACDERCGVNATAVLEIEGEADRPLAPLDAIVKGGRRAAFELTIPPDAVEQAEAALESGRDVLLRVRFAARDAAGKQRIKRASVRLTP